MKIINIVVIHFRTLFTIFVLSLALIACGGSDSSSETSSDETSSGATSGSTAEGGSTGTGSAGGGSTSEPSVGSEPAPPADDISLSTYVLFNAGGDNVASISCDPPNQVAIFQRASGDNAGVVLVFPGELRLVSGSSDSGVLACGSSGGDTLSVGGIRLTYEVDGSNSVIRLTVN